MSGPTPGRVVLVKYGDDEFVGIVRRVHTATQRVAVTIFTDYADEPLRVLDDVPPLGADLTGAHGWRWPPRV